MDKGILTRYRRNKKELKIVEKAIVRLQDKLDKVPLVKGKVSCSGKEFPYIEEHMTVEMWEPKETDRLLKRIREKEKYKRVLEAEVREVEEFISSMPEGIDKEIFEMLFLEGMTQSEVGDMVHLERSSVSKRVDSCLEKLSHHSHF